jgi:outer membrane protein assembly factor BamA
VHYWDYSHKRFSFRRFDIQAEHYLPLLNQTRVIALRARTQFSFVRNADSIPFYLQPTLGGADDLRGFNRFRFHDNNSLLLNAEYRWEVSPALDLALFADAGRVFARPGLIGFRHLEGSGGLGFRFKSRNLVVLRLDTAASREGFHIWLRFCNAFDRLPLFR